MEIASIWLDARVNLNNVIRDLRQLESKQFSINIDVDDRALTDLNQHLDKKVAHLKQVQSYFNSNPLRVRVLDRELTQLNEQLAEIEERVERINKKKLDIDAGASQSSTRANKASQDIEETLKSALEQGLEKAFDESIKSATKAIAAPFKAVGTGFFEQIGSSFSKEITKGLQTSLKKELNLDFKKSSESLFSSLLGKAKSSKPKASAQQEVQIDLSYISRSPEKAPIVVAETIKRSHAQINRVVESDLSITVKKSLDSIKEQVSSSRPDINDAKSRFAQIREKFSSAYKKLHEYLGKGDIEWARNQAQIIVDAAEKAKAEIDAIKNSLKNKGVDAKFGSELATIAGSTKGTIERSYAKPSRRYLSQIENREQFKQLGIDVVRGTTEGLKSTQPVTRQASLLAMNILQTMKKDLGIQSPSRKAIEIAKQIGQGLIIGLKESVKSVESTATKLSESISRSIEKGGKSAKKALGYQSFGELRQQVQQQRQNLQRSNFGTVEYFDSMWDEFGKQFRKKALKGFSSSESKSLTREVAGAAASLAGFLAPMQTAGAVLSPLLLPSLPLVMTGGLLKNLLDPLFGRIAEALNTVQPIQNRLNVLSGSPEGGAREMSYVQSVTSKYAVPAKEAASNYSQLAIAARGTKIEGEGVRKLFEGISASIRALNLGTYDASLIFNAYTQILAKGKVSMEELRQQLGEKFPPAMNVFAKALGVSVPELNSLIGKGAILSEDILPKVADVLIKDFGKAAENASGTFSAAMARIENAGFDLNLRLSNAFGGFFTYLANLWASVLESFNKNFELISKVASVALIGMTAQVAVAFETIMSSPAIAKRLSIVQAFFASTLKKSISALTPFLAGVFVDMIDDALGAKKSVFQNMAEGVTQGFVAIFSTIDDLTRQFTEKPLFNVGFDKENVGLIQSITSSITELIKVIPPGVGELLGLVVMFEQLAVLGKMFVIPTLQKMSSGIKDIAIAFYKSAASARNLRDSFKTIFATTVNVAGQAIAKLKVFALEAALAIGVMALSRSDFSDPLTAGFNEARTKIVDDIKSIEAALKGLENASATTGKKIVENFELPSKGLELNPGVIFGLAPDSESYKTDDFFKDINKGKFGSGGLTDAERRYAQKQKAKADSLGIGEFFTGEEKHLTLGQKQLLNQANDLTQQAKALQENLRSLNLTPDTIGNLFSGSLKKTVQDIKGIDEQIQKLSQKRVDLSLINTSETRIQVKEIDKQINDLLKSRKEKQKPLDSIFGNLDDIRSQIEEQIKAIDNSNLPGSAKRALKKILDPQKQLIEETNKYIKSQGLDKLLKPLEDTWQSVIDKLRDAEEAFDKFKTKSKIGLLGEQEQIYTQALQRGATENSIKTDISVSALKKSIAEQNALQSILAQRESALKQLLSISEVETNDARKEEIEKLRDSIKNDKTNLAELRVSIAQSKLAIANQIKEQAKQVDDFYRNIERQVKEQSIEIKKLGINTAATKAQNRLRAVLLDGYDDIVSQFIDSIIDSIEQQKQISERSLDKQSQLLQNQFSLQDISRQSLELSQSLPEKIPPIPLKVDLSSIHDDANVQALNDELQESIFTTEKLNKSLYNAEEIINSSVDSVGDLNQGFDQTTQHTVNTFNELNNVTLGLKQSKDLVGQINDLSQGWNKTLNQSQNQAQGIQGIFQGIIDWVLKLVGETQNWLSLLSSGIQVITNATGMLSGIGMQVISHPLSVGQAALSFGQGILDKVKGFFGIQPQGSGSVASPLANATLEQLIAYKPSAQQGFYGIRDGGKRRHNKIDFDSRVNAGEGAIVQAVVEGMATWRQISGNSAGVNIDTTDSQGRNITIVYNHLKLDEVQKLFGGRRSMPVVAGQRIGRVTHDALSSGPHLDFGVKINGQYVDPQVFMKNVLLPLQKSGGSFRGSQTVTQQPRYNNPVPPLPPPEQRLTYPAGYIPPTPMAASTPTAGNVNYLTRFLHIIGWGESNLQNKGPNSVGATGYFQFIPSTRRLAIQRTGLDPWSPNIQSSAEAAAAWIKKTHPSAWQAIQKGDFQSAYRLLRNEWTSLPGAAESNWGKNSTFSLQRLKQFESGNFTPRFTLGEGQQTLPLQSPQSLQLQISRANELALSSGQTKAQQIQRQSEAELERMRQELIRKNERELKQFERATRELEDRRRQGRREIKDIAFDVITDPSPEQRFKKKIEDIDRRYEDEIRDRTRQIEEALPRIQKSEKALATGLVTGDAATALQNQLNTDKKNVAELRSEIEQLTKLRSQALESAKKLFDREEQQRRTQAGFAQEKAEIEVLQSKLQVLQEIQKLNPYDERVKTIPALQEQISLKQNDLQLDEELFQLEQELYGHNITQKEYEKRAEAIKKANIQRQNEIALIRQQAEEQQQLLELQRNLDLRGQLNEMRSQNLQIQQELAQRNFARSRSLDTSALKAIQEESINAQIEAQRIAHEKQMLELREQLRKNPEIANQTKGLMLNAAFLNQSKLTQLNNSRQDLDGQLRSQQIQKQLDRLSLEEVISTPSINLQKARAQRILDIGGNIFQANALNRKAAIQEEEIRYKQEILSLEKQINEARLAGQNIDDSQIKEMYASLEKIHGINLENINRQFKTFGQTLNEVAQNAVGGLAQSFTDLIVKGGSLNDVLDNLANTILSGVLNAGLNSLFGSLFGGLFYDGGLVPNYAGGGIHRAMAKERAMSGREPMLAVVHRGEMLIPAKRVEQLNAIGLGEKELLGYANGGIVGWERNESINTMQSISKSAVSDHRGTTTNININYQVERINERNYVDEKTFREGMRKAAEAGATRGFSMMENKINKSATFRRNAGF